MGEILKNVQIFHIFALNSLLIASGAYFFPNLTTNVFVIILPGFHTSKECKSSELLVERAADPTSYKRENLHSQKCEASDCFLLCLSITIFTLLILSLPPALYPNHVSLRPVKCRGLSSDLELSALLLLLPTVSADGPWVPGCSVSLHGIRREDQHALTEPDLSPAPSHCQCDGDICSSLYSGSAPFGVILGKVLAKRKD